jgi:hypothetical protein
MKVDEVVVEDDKEMIKEDEEKGENNVLLVHCKIR